MNARELHDAYERLAPQFGYETRADTKVFDPESPNGRLMQAAIDEVFGRAIALLAAVEESDGLVRELRDWSRIYGNPYALAYDRAAARIAALEAELASVKAERDNYMHELSAALQMCEPAYQKDTP